MQTKFDIWLRWRPYRLADDSAWLVSAYRANTAGNTIQLRWPNGWFALMIEDTAGETWDFLNRAVGKLSVGLLP